MNKSLPLRLIFVLLLISMHTLRCIFPDSWALGFWALVVDALILLAIIGEIIVRWRIGRRRSLIDELVLDFLTLGTSFSKSVEEIKRATGIKSDKRIMASLRRLKLHQQVDRDSDGRWRKITF